MLRRIAWSALCLGLLAASTAPPAAAAVERYLVVFDQQKVDPAAAAELVESLGGQVYRDHSEIGVVIATSEEPGFGRLIGQAEGVLGVTVDMKRETSWSRELERMSERMAVSGPPPRSLPAPARTQAAAGSNGSIPDPTETPLWPFQWNLQIMGLEDVYAMGKFGIPQVKVAVLGAGIDYRHPDLVGKVDLDLSKSFVPSDDILVEQLFPGAHPIADLGFHTTHVAAQISCNVSFMGCVAPGTTLVGVKVLDLNEFGTIGDVVSGIRYAADAGADVIVATFSMWGPSYPQWGDKIWNWGNSEDRADIIAMIRAILYAKLKGSVVIGEASVPFFGFGIDADADGLDVILPAQAGATTIGCSGTEDVWCEISNYGFSLVHAVAPGGYVDPENPVIPFEEQIWGPCSSFSQFGRLPDECAFENQPQFITIVGPQVSVAHAAGVAALISSRFGGHLPGFFVNYKLLRSTVDIEQPGRDATTGFGRIDALKAVTGH